MRNTPTSFLKDLFPGMDQAWFEPMLLSLQMALVILLAILLRALVHRLLRRLNLQRHLPLELVVATQRTATLLIFGSAALLILERFGISGMVFWSALTGFVTVAAVAFFAAWSVLSNIFCAALIYITRPFRLHDCIEILENGEKPGLGGEVLDINLIYTTLREIPGGAEDAGRPVRRPRELKIPNSMFFQRIIRVCACSED